MKSMTGLKISKQDTWWLSGGTTREKYSNLKEIVFNATLKWFQYPRKILKSKRNCFQRNTEIVFTTPETQKWSLTLEEILKK